VRGEGSHPSCHLQNGAKPYLARQFRAEVRLPILKIVPAFPGEATERRATHGDAVMSGAKVDGPEFWGLTRLTLAPGGSLLTFNMERSGKARALSGRC